MTMRNFTPIIVEVSSTGTWNAFGCTDTATERDGQLFAILQSMGGINHTVEPGTHYFNVNDANVASLVKIPST